MDSITTDPVTITLSSAVYCFTADQTPNGMPSKIPTPTAASARRIVTGKRVNNSPVTGWLDS